MKFVHLSDLHLGKRVNEFSMLEDQRYILLRILQIIGDERPDAVIIAGDVYDKSIPPAEAVTMFDEFLVRLAGMKQQVFVISGNHDSAERIAFGGRLMDASGIHMAPVFSGRTDPFVMNDKYGEIRIYMLPFIKPTDVRHAYPGENADTYTEALHTAISHMNVDPSVRNILAETFLNKGIRLHCDKLIENLLNQAKRARKKLKDEDKSRLDASIASLEEALKSGDMLSLEP